jgi:hypothetical protein
MGMLVLDPDFFGLYLLDSVEVDSDPLIFKEF